MCAFVEFETMLVGDECTEWIVTAHRVCEG